MPGVFCFLSQIIFSYMKINFLPAKTWNWLRMNETEVKQVKADRQALEKEEIPETFAVEASTLEPIKTGMGPDMDKLAEQSGFAAKAYRMPAGIKEAAIWWRPP